MKLQILQENLNKAVTLASRFTSSRAQLPILGNVLLKADKANLTISSTNLEVSVSIRVGAKIEEEGSLTIPAKVFSELIGNLGKKTIELKTDKEQLEIKTESFSSTLLGMNSADFPTVPQSVGEKDVIKIKSSELSESLSKILFAVSGDETRPILTGVLFILDTDGLTLVATDGFRLSKTKINIKGVKNLPAQAGEKSFVIPKNILAELVRVAGEGEVIIDLQDKEKQAVFGAGESVYSSRLIEGEYPNFEKIIPTSHVYKINVDKSDFLQAVKLAGVFARDNANIVKLRIENGELRISAESSQSGNQEMKIEMRNADSQNASEFTISFNYKFIEDFIGSVTGEEIEMQFSSTDKAGVFLDPKSQDFLHLIMPVRV